MNNLSELGISGLKVSLLEGLLELAFELLHRLEHRVYGVVFNLILDHLAEDEGEVSVLLHGKGAEGRFFPLFREDEAGQFLFILHSLVFDFEFGFFCFFGGVSPDIDGRISTPCDNLVGMRIHGPYFVLVTNI